MSRQSEIFGRKDIKTKKEKRFIMGLSIRLKGYDSS